MVVWWITEAIPIYVTALVPLVLFPALGILSPKEAAVSYADQTVFLFMGGFLIAAAMITLFMAFIIPASLGISPDLPSWAVIPGK
jgi:di/tricarboxylate transporter